MSNLIKSNYIYFNHNEKRVIDSNLIKDLVTPVIFNKKFSGVETVQSKETFTEGLKVVNMEQILMEEETLLGEKVDSMMEVAKKKAEEIIQEAQEQAKQIKEEAREDAKKEGYVEGFQAGSLEMEKLENQLKVDISKHQEEYEQQVAQIEPMFVEIMIDLIEKITGVLIEDKKEVILYLVNRAMTNMENNKNFIIKVSKEDYIFLQKNKDKIHDALKEGVQIAVEEDANLLKNQCVIETETRIIDCSLDIQLSNLIADLKLLANI